MQLDMSAIKHFYYLNQISGDLSDFCQHKRTAVINSVDGCYDGSVLGSDVIKLPPFHKVKELQTRNKISKPILLKEDNNYMSVASMKMSIIQTKKGKKKIV